MVVGGGGGGGGGWGGGSEWTVLAFSSPQALFRSGQLSHPLRRPVVGLRNTATDTTGNTATDITSWLTADGPWSAPRGKRAKPGARGTLR